MGKKGHKVAVAMSHVIRWSDCNHGTSLQTIDSTFRVQLFRDYTAESSQNDHAKLAPPWKCAVLGLPNELKEEVISISVILRVQCVIIAPEHHI